MLPIPSRVIPACFALAGFAAAAIVGGFAGNDAVTVLWRALLVMAACWLIGRVVSHILQRTISEHIDQHKQRNPIPDDMLSADPDPPEPSLEATSDARSEQAVSSA